MGPGLDAVRGFPQGPVVEFVGAGGRAVKGEAFAGDGGCGCRVLPARARRRCRSARKGRRFRSWCRRQGSRCRSRLLRRRLPWRCRWGVSWSVPLSSEKNTAFPPERGGRRVKPGRSADRGGLHPKGRNEVEDPRSGLRAAAAGLEWRAAQTGLGETQQRRRPPGRRLSRRRRRQAERAGSAATGGDRDRSGNRRERQRPEIAADSPGRRHRPNLPCNRNGTTHHAAARSARTPDAQAAALASTSP